MSDIGQLVGGIWLPATERHMVEWMLKKNHVVDGKLTYQYHKLDEALKYVKHFRCAVDIGAHVGLWSMHLVKRFKSVEAFEPVALHRDLFARNVTGDNVTLNPVALGDKPGSVSMHIDPLSTGGTYIAGAGDIPLRRLDDALPNVSDVDFMKLDCEGFELRVLRGAEATIKRCMPVIIVEQKPGRSNKFGIGQMDGVEYLKTLGYKLAKELGGDFIMVPT